MRAALLVGALALLAGSGAGIVPGGYEAADCHHVFAPLPVDAAVARRDVPADFVIPGEATGRAVLLLALAACEVSVAGGPWEETWLTDAGIAVLPPPGAEPGLHIYWLWHLSLSYDLETFLASRGAPVGTLEGGGGAGFGVSEDPLLRYVGLSFFWDQASYQTSGFFLKASHHPSPDRAVSWWHDGPLGRIRLDQGFTGGEGEHGVITVGNPSGHLAELLGPPFTDLGVAVTEADLELGGYTATFA